VLTRLSIQQYKHDAMNDYKKQIDSVDRRLGNFAKAVPKTMSAYGQLVNSVMSSGALDTKTKELMALAVSVAVRCEDCIVYHTRAAINHGATETEVVESLAVAVELGGGPSVVYSARALEAFKELTA